IVAERDGFEPEIRFSVLPSTQSETRKMDSNQRYGLPYCLARSQRSPVSRATIRMRGRIASRGDAPHRGDENRCFKHASTRSVFGSILQRLALSEHQMCWSAP